MSEDREYTVDTAQEAAERDELDDWVIGFLASPGSDNAPLADELSQRAHSWLGPVRLPIDRLHRLAGPSDAPVLCPVDDEAWNDDVDEMAQRIEDGWDPPPVVVVHRDDHLALEDGNHRVESLRRAGRDHAWAVIAFEDAAARDRFEVPGAA
jgi:hypothetical protein